MLNPLWVKVQSQFRIRTADIYVKSSFRFSERSEKLQHTWTLHQVFLLAVAVTADMIEGEEKVMLLVQLSRQLYLYLEVRKIQRT